MRGNEKAVLDVEASENGMDQEERGCASSNDPAWDSTTSGYEPQGGE